MQKNGPLETPRAFIKLQCAKYCDHQKIQDIIQPMVLNENNKH
jgi:hypothetical protein